MSASAAKLEPALPSGSTGANISADGESQPDLVMLTGSAAHDELIPGRHPLSQVPAHGFDDLWQFGSRVALVDEDGVEWSYRDLVEAADEAALVMGSERHLVAIAATNTVRSLIAYVGARRARHPVLLMGHADADSALLERFSVEYVHSPATEARFVQVGESHADLHPELAVLLATSGSTGMPKLVRLSARNLDSNAHAISDYLGFTAGERAITTLPFNYSYGLSVINSHLITGQCIILNDRSVADPIFWKSFDDQCATSFAGVPYSFELLSRSGFLHRPPPRSLRYFTQAGGKLPSDCVRAFAQFARANSVRFFVMYGQTEASPRIAYVPPDLIEMNPSAIGYPIPGGRIDLADESGQLIDEPAVEGELIYRGPNVMMGYAVSPEDLASGHELTELRTGDLAIRDDIGMITITGRKSRFVKLFGFRIGLDDIEALLREHGLVAVASGDDQGIRLIVHDAACAEQAVGLVCHRYGLPSEAVVAMYLPEIPRLDSGKVDYAAIAAIPYPEPVATSGAPSLESEVAASIGGTFDPTLSFSEMSADSLSYVRVSLLLEEYLGYTPEGWEEIPIRQLCGLELRATNDGESSDQISSLTNLRASLMLLGLPYHAAMAYSFSDWIVKADVASPTAHWFAEAAHTFRMPAFFLIAGFFAMLLIKGQPPARWTGQRIKALAAPLLIAVVVINPIIMLGRSVANHDGGDVLVDWTHQLSTLGPHWIEHAWFLIFLLVYSLGLAIHRHVAQPIDEDAAKGEVWMLASTGNLLKFSVYSGALVTVLVMLLTALGLNFLFAEMLWTSYLVALAPMFLLGCMVSSRRDALDRFAHYDRPSVLIALTSVAVLACIQERNEAVLRGLTYFLIPVTSVFTARILIYMGRRWLTRRSPALNFLVDASMTIYLVHQVFLVFLIPLFNKVYLPPLFEIAIISLTALLLSVLVHHTVKLIREAVSTMVAREPRFITMSDHQRSKIGN